MVQQHIVVEEAVEELQLLVQHDLQEETEEVVQEEQIAHPTLYLEQSILEVEAVATTLLEPLVVVDLEL